MPSVSDWKVPRENQPKPADYDYDLATAVASVVGVRAEIPDDAFTAHGGGLDGLAVPHHREQRHHPGMWEVDLIDFLAGFQRHRSLRQRHRRQVGNKQIEVAAG